MPTRWKTSGAATLNGIKGGSRSDDVSTRVPCCHHLPATMWSSSPSLAASLFALHRPLHRGPRIHLHARFHGDILAARYTDISFANPTGHIMC